MAFGGTLLASLIGALAGALVGAFAAWLFSLDLRRREREDRSQEREEERLDRLAQRQQDALDRASERVEERRFQNEERERLRHQNYEVEMMREWPRLAAELSDYANANRAVADRRTTDSSSELFDGYRRSVTSLTRCLYEMATIANGADHEIVNNVGVMVATLQPYERESIAALDRIHRALSIYMAARPDDREESKSLLQSKLAEVVAAA